MATYLAVSTINFYENGYTVYGKSSQKQQALKEAEKHIKNEQYSETLYANLIVLSKTRAKRDYGIIADDLVFSDNKYEDIYTL